MFDVRILRYGYPSRQEVKVSAEASSPHGDVSGSAEGTTTTSPIITVAVTGRGIRVNDGAVLVLLRYFFGH
jgi:hypothetical protein